MILEYHPKFVERWGKVYIDRYVKDSEAAIKWAIGFFPDDIMPLLIKQAKVELKRRGIPPKQEE